MRTLLTDPDRLRLPLIAPSILSADFTRMGEECAACLSGGESGAGGGGEEGGEGAADLLHLDVMDAHFVPNLTMGPDMARWIRRGLPDAFLDVHLMVTDPGLFVEPFAKAGADHLTFHVEAVPAGEIAPLAARIRAHGMTVGLAVNPPTPLERLLPHIGAVDLVLVMSVNPGFSGQQFITGSLERTRAVKARLRRDQRLEMDGGINAQTAPGVREAGCDVMVAASAIFGIPVSGRAAAIASLRGPRPRLGI